MPTDAKALMSATVNELDQFAAAAAEIIADEPADTISPEIAQQARERRNEAEYKRGRAYARLTNAEKAVLAAARDISINQIDTNVEYQQALAAAAAADLEYATAESIDLVTNPPSEQIATAEKHAINTAKALDEAYRVFRAESELSLLAKAAYEGISVAEEVAALALDGLRRVAKEAAEADPALRGALGAMKAVTISRTEKISVAEPLAAYLALRDWAGDNPAKVAAILNVIDIDAKAVAKLVTLPTPIKTTVKKSFTVSVTAGKLTQ